MDPTLLGVLPGTTGNVDPNSAFPIAGWTGAAYGTGTGQHGVAPSTIGATSVQQAIQNIWGWLNQPFTQAMSPTDVFLLVGVVIIAIILWNLILYHIRIAAETI